MRSVPRIPRHLIYATTLRIGVISLTLLTGVAVGMPEHPAAAARRSTRVLGSLPQQKKTRTSSIRGFAVAAWVCAGVVP
jgi:hypothetical protein